MRADGKEYTRSLLNALKAEQAPQDKIDSLIRFVATVEEPSSSNNGSSTARGVNNIRASKHEMFAHKVCKSVDKVLKNKSSKRNNDAGMSGLRGSPVHTLLYATLLFFSSYLLQLIILLLLFSPSLFNSSSSFYPSSSSYLLLIISLLLLILSPPHLLSSSSYLLYSCSLFPRHQPGDASDSATPQDHPAGVAGHRREDRRV